MNESDKESLKEFVDLVTESLSQGKDFVLEQSPLVVQELLAYKQITSIAALLTIVVFIVANVLILKKLTSWYRTVETRTDAELGEFGIMAAIVAMCMGIIVVIPVSLWAMKVWLAPRLYVLEYVASLLK